MPKTACTALLLTWSLLAAVPVRGQDAPSPTQHCDCVPRNNAPVDSAQAVPGLPWGTRTGFAVAGTMLGNIIPWAYNEYVQNHKDISRISPLTWK